MIRISESISIAASSDRVWAILHDAAAVAGCIPGAELTAEKGPGFYEANISVKFGPTVAHFSGEARVAYDEDVRRLTVSGRGNDQRGSSPITGSGVVNVMSDLATELKIDGQFEISGPLESFVETGGVFVARALLAQFAANIAQLVDAQGAVENGEPAAAAQAAIVPISAGGLLKSMLVGWLRAVFARWSGRTG